MVVTESSRTFFENPPEWELCIRMSHTMMAISSLSEAARLEFA